MSDKIANFEDYKKRESAGVADPLDNMPADPVKEVTQETMDIQIEDPYVFFNEEERKEYLRARQNELKNRENEKRPEAAPERESREIEREPSKEKREPVREQKERRRRDHDDPEDYDDYDDYDDPEDYDEDEGGLNMNLIVRISSIITGIVILVVIGMFVFAKVSSVINPGGYIFREDPDEAQEVSVALPEGYEEKNTTMVVTTDLNLRTVPSTESKEYIATVAKQGTELKVLAISKDGSWALIDYNGQTLYGSTKYLEDVKE